MKFRIPMAPFYFVIGLLGIGVQIRAGHLPSTIRDWAWLIVCSVFVFSVLAWWTLGERILRWVDRKYEETMPEKRDKPE